MVLKINTEKPIYKHDCTSCVYQLSIVDSNDNTINDIYVCHNGGIKTLILRFGNKEQENLSYEWECLMQTNNTKLTIIRKMLMNLELTENEKKVLSLMVQRNGIINGMQGMRLLFPNIRGKLNKSFIDSNFEKDIEIYRNSTKVIV